MSVGSVDPNCASSVANAWAGGMSNVAIYFFPCPTCGDAAGQVNTMNSYISQNQVKYTTMWWDIEGTQYWTDVNDNVAFFQELVSTAQGLGMNLGVYTSASQWLPIMGSSTAGSSMPLWYAHYDNNPSFSDFSPFGGWSSPVMKQYNGDQTVCGAGVDLNWTPGAAPTTGATTGPYTSSTSSSTSSSSSSSGGDAVFPSAEAIYNQIGGKGNAGHFKLSEEKAAKKF
eukprot:Phypoly_transcript_18933.p1 GENE.Phypoly_transcript_18933~~Phypoly_transcript_18933.p1  ORF type:complete len:235 (+),score=54.12 Phypoly_transcript_18933:25-705(+)